MSLKQKCAVPISALGLMLFLAISNFLGCMGTTLRKPNPILPGDYRYLADYAEHRIRQLMHRHRLPSLAAALIDDQDIVSQKTAGWANLEKKIPAAANTIYKLWSVSKVFTAIETMRLVEEGRIDLNASVTDYLPDFSIQNRFPDSGPITVRSILAHHSGLPRNHCHTIAFRPGDREGLGEMVKSMKYGHMAFPVGRRFKYSNIGPDMLGCMIQELRDESFARRMKENLLAPLGMENSAFLSAELPAQRDIALGYEYYKGKYYPYPQGDVIGLPSGNLYSTIEDMCNFVKFIFRGGEADGKQIVRPETFRRMFEDQFSNQRNPQPMGLGWKITRALRSECMVWHDGGPSEGIGSLVALIPVDQGRFRVSHWLLKLGLARFFRLPIDLRELEIEFLAGNEKSDDVMIINIAGISYEICPRYPDFVDIPALWQKLAGEYELVARLPSGLAGTDIRGHAKIWVEKGVLQVSGMVGPVWPIGDTDIVILGGPFVGETMAYQPDTGNIYHYSVVYKPTKAELNKGKH